MPIVYVLWGLGLLSLIALSLLSSGDLSYRRGRDSIETARMEAFAEVAVNRSVLGLLDPRPNLRWRVDGLPQAFIFEGTKMRVTVNDELGRVDLNNADEGLLIGLLQSAGLDASSAGRLADKILDWREAGSSKRLNGAKTQDYRVSGLAAGPRGGKFQSTDEVKLVIGMTDELFNRIEPAITVYSGRQFIDPQFAPRESLLALPAMNAEVVAAILSNRANAQVGVIPPTVSLGGRTFRLLVETVENETPMKWEVILRITDDPAQPYWIMSWKTK